ncbi:hypothetical protein EST38_g8422 [Candolleomyces aberdarensis]|uniref:J domain-containing protein n=1 Tax=Candolleomyces aberdarensis TaxID=2316362 RepID=A0A4Q2DEC7_9AGAR|nr:hypothetical protein EST38_g8422 [Candolleomyces aberdarensis]
MASHEEESDISPYELLNVSIEATDQEIKSAYRQRSLKVHPDRNPNNPDAARKFHELNQAYELLLDPLRRLALDAKLRVKQARAERFKTYDTKRKNLVEELEERERAFKKARVQKQKEEVEVYHQTERIKEEGRRMREEREKATKERERLAEEEQKHASMDADSELEPPPLDQFDTTVRLKYSLKSHSELTTKENIASYLSPFGSVDVDSIVFSMKAKKSKSKSKGSGEAAPTHATALVPFKTISDAYAAVTASSTRSSSSRVDLSNMEITWVNNKEPLILGWLKKMGKLSAEGTSSNSSPAGGAANSTVDSNPNFDRSSTAATPTPFGAPAGSTPFSSFPNLGATSSSTPSFSFPGSGQGAGTTTAAPGLDYESLTMLRLRQAERESWRGRLENERRKKRMEHERAFGRPSVVRDVAQ